MDITYNNQTAVAPLTDINLGSDFSIALKDIRSSIKSFSLWHYLAFNEIRRRYRRTVIGPFWTTLSVAIFIGIMSMMLSLMWKTDVKEFLPFFCTGYIAWTMISTIIMEGCGAFSTNVLYLKQLNIPFTIYACLVPWRNFLVLGHHLPTILLSLFYCGITTNFNIIFIVPGLFLIFVTSVALTIILGMICARFRDIKQLIESTLPLMMFVTPIMWKPDQLGRKGILVTKFNPLYHYIKLLRDPLLGQPPELYTWFFSTVCTVGFVAAALLLFVKKYRNIIFWL